jgi:hypothetical protein
MRDEDFDEILKGKLQEEDSLAPDWQSMQDRLDQEAELDRALDTRVAQAAGALVDDDEPDWSSFADRQTRLRDRHKTILSIKSAELLLLLLCMSIYGVSSRLWSDLSQAMDQPILMADASTTLLLQRSTDDIIPLRTIQHTASPELSSTSTYPILHPAYSQVRTTISEAYSTKDQTPSIASPITIAPLATTTPPIASTEPARLGPSKPYSLEIQPSDSRPSGWLAGIGFSRNADFIYTPTDVVYKGLAAYSTVEQGYTVDLTIRRRLGRFDINSGLAYTRQSYDPRPFSETNIDDMGQVVTARLSDISFDIIKIPLSLSYHYTSRGAVSAFVSAGLTSNWVVNTNYQVKQEKQSPNRRVVRAVDITNGKEIGKEFQLSEKDFSPGLLSGGSLAQNLFLSATIDAGAEIRISDNTNVRLSAGYMHNLGVHIGPNQNRIHSLSMRLGVSRLM